ncbi:MAG: hypothetical protein OJF49_001478 [Ktedonobacterales bacterium]|jgi:hypothetical protein|nr:MAG: hypothetical protein OJF49_001478 [Ktedonobacterales bacterium]
MGFLSATSYLVLGLYLYSLGRIGYAAFKEMRMGRGQLRAVKLSPTSLADWTRSLHTLQVLNPEHDAEPALCQELSLNWMHVTGSMHVSAAWGAILACLVSIPVALLTALPLLGTTGPLPTFTLLLVGVTNVLLLDALRTLFGAILGYTAGYLRGLSRLEPFPSQKSATPEIATPHVSDYRASALGLAPVAMLVLAVGIAGVYAPFGLLPASGNVIFAPLESVQNAMLGVSLIFAVLVVIAGEIAIHRVAVSSRRLFIWSLPIAQRADEKWRALAIGNLFAAEIQMAGTLLIAPALLILLVRVSGLSGTQLIVVLFAYFILTMLSTSLARGILKMHGRLGGRLTGWPARKRGRAA